MNCVTSVSSHFFKIIVHTADCYIACFIVCWETQIVQRTIFTFNTSSTDHQFNNWMSSWTKYSPLSSFQRNFKTELFTRSYPIYTNRLLYCVLSLFFILKLVLTKRLVDATRSYITWAVVYASKDSAPTGTRLYSSWDSNCPCPEHDNIFMSSQVDSALIIDLQSIKSQRCVEVLSTYRSSLLWLVCIHQSNNWIDFRVYDRWAY